MSAPYVLSVDLGTSGPKAAVVGRDGTVAGAGQRPVTTRFPEPGAAEQDPDEIWAATLSCCHAALASAHREHHVRPDDVVAVIASSQYSSIVPVDAAGRALHPMVLWMDQRGAPRNLRRLPGAPRRGDSPVAQLRWLRVHGLPPIEGGIALTHMRWIRAARPQVYEHTAAFLEPMDYLALRLSGRAAANQCTAFMSLTMDNRTLGATQYHAGLVAQSHIDHDRLPELVTVGEPLGPLLPEVAARLGLHPGTPVLSGCNDTQAGSIAAGAYEGSHVGVSLGTTGVIVTHRDARKTDPRTAIFTMPGPLGDDHLVSAENGVAGAGLDHFLRTLVYGDDPFGTHGSAVDRYAAFDEAAGRSPAGARGVTYLPWLRGSLAPKADPRMRGGFLGVGLDTDRNDLARALMEGVALNFRWLHETVERFVGRTSTHVVFYGGGAGSARWSQVTADVLRRPVHQLADPRHANTLGTALLAFERTGVIGRDEMRRIPRVNGVFEPNGDHAALYDDLAERFRDTFARTRPLFRRAAPAGRQDPGG
jgi:xylulokinase